jgi:tRNA threonylcarbamoyladenosine biosynthesis protein TsaB
MTSILALNTADSACSVTLKINNQYFSKTQSALHHQAEYLLPFIDNILQQAGCQLSQLDALAFSSGPASFTSLRLALSAIQGLAMPYHLPIIPICSLQALAYSFYLQNCPSDHQIRKIVVCTNAYMGQLFWGAFRIQKNSIEVEQAACLVSPEKLPELAGNDWFGVGNAWTVYAEALSSLQTTQQVETTYAHFLPASAEAIADLAERLLKEDLYSTLSPDPVYLRDENAWKKKTVPPTLLA